MPIILHLVCRSVLYDLDAGLIFITSEAWKLTHSQEYGRTNKQKQCEHTMQAHSLTYASRIGFSFNIFLLFLLRLLVCICFKFAPRDEMKTNIETFVWNPLIWLRWICVFFFIIKLLYCDSVSTVETNRHTVRTSNNLLDSHFLSGNIFFFLCIHT